MDWMSFQRNSVAEEQPPFLLSRFGTQIIRGWHIANESWAISKLGDTLASETSCLRLPSPFGRKRSKQGRTINNAWDTHSGQRREADIGLHWTGCGL